MHNDDSAAWQEGKKETRYYLLLCSKCTKVYPITQLLFD